MNAIDLTQLSAPPYDNRDLSQRYESRIPKRITCDVIRNSSSSFLEVGTFRSATNPEYELRLTSSLSALAAFVSGRFASCLRDVDDAKKQR
jgi:hypothetical protein